MSFFPLWGVWKVGNMEMRIGNYTKTRKVISLEGSGKERRYTFVVPYTVIGGRIQGRAQASASAGSLPRHPQGKWPGPASRDYSPAAVLTSRTVHSSEGTRQGRCGEEVIPGPAKKQESRDKKYGK